MLPPPQMIVGPPGVYGASRGSAGPRVSRVLHRGQAQQELQLLLGDAARVAADRSRTAPDSSGRYPTASTYATHPRPTRSRTFHLLREAHRVAGRGGPGRHEDRHPLGACRDRGQRGATAPGGVRRETRGARTAPPPRTSRLRPPAHLEGCCIEVERRRPRFGARACRSGPRTRAAQDVKREANPTLGDRRRTRTWRCPSRLPTRGTASAPLRARCDPGAAPAPDRCSSGSRSRR